MIYLRRLLEELAWTQHIPDLAHLLGRDDVPRKEHHLPRPLTPEQDELVQQELLRRDDLLSNALLLLRHTGMRISECVDLSFDCLRLVGPGQWAIHVPLGKLKTERLVPVDSVVCQLVERIRSLRPPTAPKSGPSPIASAARSLPDDSQTACRLARRHRRRLAFPPASSRTNFDTHMELRCCAPALALPRLIKLLGHKSPHMTLQYLEITQQDLQREFHLALSHPRHLVPSRTTPPGPAPSRRFIRPDRLFDDGSARARDLSSQRYRSFRTPSSRSPCQSHRQNPHSNQKTQTLLKMGRDWPVKSGCGK